METSGPEPRPGAIPRAEARRLREARERRDDGSGPSKPEQAFDQGARGEEIVGERLNAETSRWGGFGVMHSVVAHGDTGDIDHLVVGPAGVTIVDSKMWNGKASVRRGVLRMASRDKQGCFEGVERQAEKVRRALAEAGSGAVPVGGALCLVNDNLGTPGLQWVGHIAVGAPAAVVDYVTRPGSLDVRELCRVQAILASHFQVFGGSVDPSPSLRPVETPRAVPIAPRRRRTSRVSPRLVQACAGLALIVAAPLVALAVFDTATAALQSMSRSELAANRAEYRALAERRAHGQVRGPRVLTTAEEFRLVFRRGKRCRIVIDVSRTPKALGPPGPIVRSVGCRRAVRG